MTITQLLKLTDNERSAIATTISVCKELAEKTNRPIDEVFMYLYSEAFERPNYMLDEKINLPNMD